MSTPHKCPVCDGSGQVPSQGSTATHVNCGACNGAGIVWDHSAPAKIVIRIAPHETMIPPWPETGHLSFEHVVPATFSYDTHAA